MRSRSSFFYGVALLLTLWGSLLWAGIDQPAHPSSEETHYIPAARLILNQGTYTNSEHPPLAKLGIAAGIAVFGDSPQGWRFFSVLSSILFLAGILRLALSLGFTHELALTAAAFVAFNGVAFTLGRLAMLEMPMLAFLVWAIALWLESQHEANRHKSLIGLICSGAFFGFSAAAKWAGGLGFLITVSATLLLLLLRYWKVSFGLNKGRAASEFYHHTLWRSLSGIELFAALLVSAWVSYFCTFLPLYGATGGWNNLREWFHLQSQMWNLQQQVTQSHPYGTQWYEWLIPTRAIWFEYTRQAPGHVRAIFLLANPVVTLLGLTGAAIAVPRVLKRRDFAAFWLLYFYAGLYLIFALIPRKLSFYYYYAPALTFWSLLAAWSVDQIPARLKRPLRWVTLLASIAMFSYFYPVYSARLVLETSVAGWAWLQSWI